MSYSVSQRTQEIGIRMALGAKPGDVLRLIVAGGMAMAAVGIVAGLVLSTLLTRSMNSLLYGIGIFDAPSFFATAALLLSVALVACWIPARRAASVDPMVALKYEQRAWGPPDRKCRSCATDPSLSVACDQHLAPQANLRRPLF